jgi:hypothetical protein
MAETKEAAKKLSPEDTYTTAAFKARGGITKELRKLKADQQKINNDPNLDPEVKKAALKKAEDTYTTAAFKARGEITKALRKLKADQQAAARVAFTAPAPAKEKKEEKKEGAPKEEVKGPIPATEQQITAAKDALMKLFKDAQAAEDPEKGWKTQATDVIIPALKKSTDATTAIEKYAVPDLIVLAENLLLDQTYHDNAAKTPLENRMEGLKKDQTNDKINTAITNIATAASEGQDKLWEIMKIVIQVRDEAMDMLATAVAAEATAASPAGSGPSSSSPVPPQ